jgi:hypothetical protein
MKREHPGPVSVSVYKCRTSSVYNPTIQDATYVYCLYKYTMKPVINRTFLGPAFICSKWKGVVVVLFPTFLVLLKKKKNRRIFKHLLVLTYSVFLYLYTLDI